MYMYITYVPRKDYTINIVYNICCTAWCVAWFSSVYGLYCTNNADMESFTLFADPTLTVEKLVGAMQKLTSDKTMRRKVWGEVLWWEGHTPDLYLVEVDTKYTTEKEKTNVLADVYINSRPDPSWEHLVKTFYRNNEVAAAKEAKTFLQQNGE